MFKETVILCTLLGIGGAIAGPYGVVVGLGIFCAIKKIDI